MSDLGFDALLDDLGRFPERGDFFFALNETDLVEEAGRVHKFRFRERLAHQAPEIVEDRPFRCACAGAKTGDADALAVG